VKEAGVSRSRINPKDKKKTMSHFQYLIFSIQYCSTHRFLMVNENVWPHKFVCLTLQKQETVRFTVGKVATVNIVMKSCTL